ncbi:sulfatase-like hydrolase/transferase [Aureibaculum sp. 2210JD6-5]|nr:sulfatase-like hydrolase/transferase [Aureibaculum sp. 2210JD6-5]MDY7394515.1 sulfatase-like hydrolase/transferase [Aureibaculum sp. 2210JD6-5]
MGWRWASNKDNHFMNDTIKIGDYNLKGRNELWKNIDFSKEIGGGPLEAGFDYYFGDDVPNFPPYAFIENNKFVQIPNQIKPDTMYGGPGPMVEGWSLEKVMPTITKKAVNYIQEQSNKENPFFLYFALTAPHTPIAPTKDFKGKSKAGLYGDFVNEVDWSVGQIVEALEKSGQLENTILIFTSDNGSPQRDGQDMGGAIASVLKYGHNPSGKWRGMKADIWEGGHRVPFIVSWPNKIKKNTTSDKIICTTDIFATATSILGKGQNNSLLEDSFDFSHALFNKVTSNPERNSIVHHSIDGTFAIRHGDWKLILGKDSGGFSKNLKIEDIPVATNGQLYNLKNDPSEKNNLYDKLPSKVKELTDLLNKNKDRGYNKHN